MSEPRQHSNDKTLGKHRECLTIRRHLPYHAVRDAFPNELQQRTVDEAQEVQAHRRYGPTEDPSGLYGHISQQPATGRLNSKPECELSFTYKTVSYCGLCELVSYHCVF